MRTNAEGDSVVVCTKPFDTAPAVRLPSDVTKAGSVSFYGAITTPTTRDNVALIWTRDGKRWVPVDADGSPVLYADDAKLPAGLHAPTNRATFTVYQFSGKPAAPATPYQSPFGDALPIRLTAARAVVEMDGCTFDSRLAGTWDGTLSERLETPVGSPPVIKYFDPSKRVPIHVTLDIANKSANFTEYDGGDSMRDQKTFRLAGTIDNFDHDVDVDGKRYSSLKAMGSRNPLLGARDGRVDLYRVGNMHGLKNDAHWVVTYPNGMADISASGMSNTLIGFTAPSFLSDDATFQHIEIKPHIPFYANGSVLELAPLRIGDKTGTCPN